MRDKIYIKRMLIVITNSAGNVVLQAYESSYKIFMGEKIKIKRHLMISQSTMWGGGRTVTHALDCL